MKTQVLILFLALSLFLGKEMEALICMPVSSVHAGASGVGRSHIKNALLSQNPDKFSYPAPCE